MIIELTLTSIVVDKAIMSVNGSHVDILLDATIAFPLNLCTIPIVHLLKFSIVPVHQFGKPATEQVALLLDFAFTKIPLREVLILGALT